jgi:hypothetical protein
VSLLADYVRQNPVHGGLVGLPKEWQYSSCREYYGQRPAGFLDLSEVLTRLDGAPDYRSYHTGSYDAELAIPFRSRFREELRIAA